MSWIVKQVWQQAARCNIKDSKIQFMTNTISYMYRYQSAIFRESNKTKEHITNTPIQALIAVTVINKY
jgi:hypothetical protein